MHSALGTLLVWTFEAVLVRQFQQFYLACRPGIADSNLQIGLTVRKGVGGTCPARLAGRRLKQQGILPALLDLQPPFPERSTPGCSSVPNPPACAPTPSAAAINAQQTSAQPVLAAVPAPAQPMAAANPETQQHLVAGSSAIISAAGVSLRQKFAEPGAAGFVAAASGTQVQQHLSAAQRQGPTGAPAAVVMSQQGASLAGRPMLPSQKEGMMQPSAVGSILQRAPAPRKAVHRDADVAPAAASRSPLPQQEAVSLSEPAISRQEQQPQLSEPNRVHQPPSKVAAQPQCSGLAAILPRLASKAASQKASSAVSATAAQTPGPTGKVPLRPSHPTDGQGPMNHGSQIQPQVSFLVKLVTQSCGAQSTTGHTLLTTLLIGCRYGIPLSTFLRCFACGGRSSAAAGFVPVPPASPKPSLQELRRKVPVQARLQVKPVSSLQVAASAAGVRRRQDGAQRPEAQWLLDEEEGFDELLEEVDTMLRDPTDP